MILFAAWLTAGSGSAAAKVLLFTLTTQEQDQWCWAAVSSAIIKYYGTNAAQCAIADYTRTRATWHDFGSVPCCTDAGQGCNYWNYIMGSAGSIQDILQNWGLQSTALVRQLYANEVEAAVNDNRPFVIRWGWTSGGGHFVVGHGIDGSQMNYMDPWYGEGLKVASYDYVVSGGNHTWTHTAVVTTPWTTQTYPLNIEASAGGTTDPPPGSYSFSSGGSVVLTAIPSTSYQFYNWSGDASGSTNPVTVAMSGPKTVRANFLLILAPLAVQGQKVLNRSLSQAEYINVLTWQNNPQNINIDKYRIYTLDGSTWTMLAESDTAATRYLHRKVSRSGSCVYRIIAVTTLNREGMPAEITIK